MYPIQVFLRNPVKVSVGVLFVALFGTIALLRMPMQLTPEVQIPTITVQTRWPGASPREVEREIVREQEEFLQSVEGVTKMTSESQDSVGAITLEFKVGTDMEEALLKVNSRLQQVPEYPIDANEPVISASSAEDRPIAWFILNPKMPDRAEIEQFQADHPELAAELGISATDLGYTVNALIDGAYATDYYISGDETDSSDGDDLTKLCFVGGDKIDLVILGGSSYTGRTQDIESLPIATPSGVVPIRAVANVSLRTGPEQINHRERQRAITIQVSPPPDVSLEEAIGMIDAGILRPLLIVHQSLNHMRYDHQSPQQAILESVRTRIRPIFMTTATTVFGLMPLVLFPGAGSELYRGLGSVVLGGLLVSTLFTLLLIPTLFSLFMDLAGAFRGSSNGEP